MDSLNNGLYQSDPERGDQAQNSGSRPFDARGAEPRRSPHSDKKFAEDTHLNDDEKVLDGNTGNSSI